MTKVECPQKQTCRRWPFCRPPWLSFVGQNPYSNLNKSSIEAIHIRNLKEIRLKMTKLEWPQQRTEGQAENNRALPTFVGPGGALKTNSNILTKVVFIKVFIWYGTFTCRWKLHQKWESQTSPFFVFFSTASKRKQVSTATKYCQQGSQ